jgi:hypothetical protein
MSDDNYRKRPPSRATRIGLGLSGADASYDEHPGVSSSDKRTTGRGLGTVPPSHLDGNQNDEAFGDYSGEHREHGEGEDRYMDPPSESHGVEREQIVQRLRAETEASAAARSVPNERVARAESLVSATAATGAVTGAQGLFGSTLRAHTGHGRFEAEHGTELQRGRISLRDPAEHGDQAEYNEPGSASRAAPAGLFQGALDHTVRAQPMAAQPVTTRPPPPPAPAGPRAAPEAWRDEVRRMVERAPTKGPGPAPSAPSAHGAAQPQGSGYGGNAGAGPSYGGNPGAGQSYGGNAGAGQGYGGGPSAPPGSGGPGLPGTGKPSLRLKLDAGAVAVAESYRAPKSVLPKLIAWLLILGLIGGGLAVFAETQGGVAAVIKRLSGGKPTLTTQETAPPAQAPTAQPGVATQQPTAAATAEPQAAPPTAAPAAAPPVQPAAAKPAEPAAAPKEAAPVAQPQAPKAAEPKPAAAPAAKPAAPAAKAPPRQVRPQQQPVVKVRPIESGSSQPSSAPPSPDGLDIPYVPMPDAPPEPEAR